MKTDANRNGATAGTSIGRARAARSSRARTLVLGIGAMVSLALPASSLAAAERTATQAYSARALVARGDAEVVAGHPGAAIVDYERARLLVPRSSAVASGLARAQAAAGLPRAAPAPLARLLQELGPDEWSWVALAGFGLAAASCVGLSWSRRRRPFVAAIGLGGLAIAVGAFATARRLSPSPGAAIVVSPEVIARIAPFDAAEPAFVAPEGSRVDVERFHQRFALIRDAAGEGWVPRETVETVVPAPPPRS